jgi:FdhD protein
MTDTPKTESGIFDGSTDSRAAAVNWAPVTVPVRVLGASTGAGAGQWCLAEEVPVNLAYNGRPHVVMMATPQDLEDFAVGFSLSEGVLTGLGQIRQIQIDKVEGGVMVDVTTAMRAEIVRERQARSLEGRSGCGLCGLQRLDQVVRQVNPVKANFQMSPDALGRAFAQLPDHQAMNRVNRSVHAAAWAMPDGTIDLIREDVGRHNALDKLIGALALADADTSAGFCVMTSRCSFELVQKAAAVGIPWLATVSAPTSLALDLARRAGMGLACAARDGVVLFDAE